MYRLTPDFCYPSEIITKDILKNTILTNNDINSILVEKVSNTETLAVLVIKILKIHGQILNNLQFR